MSNPVWLCFPLRAALRAALFLPAADSFPRSPELSLPLTDPGLVGVLVGAAERIGYAIT